MFVLDELRDKLDFVARTGLCYYDGELLLLKKDGERITIVSAVIKVVRYWLKLIPIYKVTEQGHSRLSVFNDIVRPIQTIPESLRIAIKRYSETTWKTVVKGMTDFLTKRLEILRKAASAKIISDYASFHQRFLTNVISKSQNDFRKQLTDIIRTTASEGLTASLQKHITMFLIKMREEEQRRVQTDYISSGPEALPNGCKFVFKRKDATVYVVEQIPQVRTISYLGKHYRISLPYIVFLATFRAGRFLWLQVLFRTSALRSEADTLLCPALPNIHDKQEARYQICFPAPEIPNASLAKLVEEVIQNYWGSPFNKDLSGFFNVARSQFAQICTFEEWEKQTSRDAQLALKIAWPPAGIDLSRLVNSDINSALSINSDKPPVQGTADVLQNYAQTVGEKFSKELCEKLHFMMSHSHIDMDSLTPAQEELRKLINTTAEDIKNGVHNALYAPLRPEELNELCGVAEQQLVEEMENITMQPIEEITEKLRSL